MNRALDVATRPRVHGKFLYVGSEKLYVRGVTYGPLCSPDRGDGYGDRDVVEQDFARMAGRGLNALRTYTVPPNWLLDAAWRHGLHVMVGVPWEQHIAFLDNADALAGIEDGVHRGVRSCAGHPAVLCYAIGNEIPASIVRWHDRAPVERFLKRLYTIAKAEDPAALVTYVNYPSTEYLRLPFLDLVCFNVYLEQPEGLRSYLARLQNIAGYRPLLMTEIGLDSLEHGEQRQAQVLDWQVRTVFAAGCAGAFVFAWTDQWYRGGQEIHDWAFGLTTVQREPKPALARVQKAFAEAPVRPDGTWPRMSVLVCSHNGARTIDWCLRGVTALEYPNYEVIVIDDGSTDNTGEIARRHGVHVIRTANCGLSHARNVGMEAATGEIVAYIDDDATPDPHWLTYLATTFTSTTHVCVGGPNLPPGGDGPVADCVANAPGGPVHVLLSDEEAEHVPGCNMAFRRAALQSIGGFDTQFRVAGDDVDVCWRLQERGWTLGFSPAAVVWHRRRSSIRAYWRQQKGYGKAEALLERKWREKYNAAGHMTWSGRLYGYGLGRRRGRVYHGVWGSALFQSIYEPAPGLLASLPSMPEWYLILTCLAALSVVGISWHSLLVAFPMLFCGTGAVAVQAGAGAANARFTGPSASWLHRWKLCVLTAFLYVIQPLARLVGRIRHGLTPWRSCAVAGYAIPRSRGSTMWSERWHSPEEWLGSIEQSLKQTGYGCVIRGGAFDRWDLELRGGGLGAIRVRVAIEEHGTGRQLLRLRSWPRWSFLGIVIMILLAELGVAAMLAERWVAGVFLIAAAGLLAGRALQESAAATSAALCAVDRRRQQGEVQLSPRSVEERA